MGSLQEFRNVCSEIIARLSEDTVGDWWNNIRFLTQRLEDARQGLQIGWQDPYQPNPAPALLIVELPDKWQEQPETQPRHIQSLRSVGVATEWGTFLMSRDPEQTDCCVSAIRAKVIDSDLVIGSKEQARLKALQTAKQWLRAAERLPDALGSPDDESGQSDLLRAADPEAAAFRERGEWCTAGYAQQRYGIRPQQLTRAATQEKGLGGIIVTRRMAQVGEGKRGQVYVYHAGDLQRLANHLDHEE